MEYGMRKVLVVRYVPQMSVSASLAGAAKMA